MQHSSDSVAQKGRWTAEQNYTTINDVSFIWFTDEKVFTAATPTNSIIGIGCNEDERRVNKMPSSRTSDIQRTSFSRCCWCQLAFCILKFSTIWYSSIEESMSVVTCFCHSSCCLCLPYVKFIFTSTSLMCGGISNNQFSAKILPGVYESKNCKKKLWISDDVMTKIGDLLFWLMVHNTQAHNSQESRAVARKPRYRSCSIRFKVHRQHSL